MLTATDPRCVGRESLRTDGQVCPQRQQCGRFQALMTHPDGETLPWPAVMWLCQTEKFERRLPVVLAEG